MKIFVGADNKVMGVEITDKLVAIGSGVEGIEENSLYSAIEMGISGEPMQSYIELSKREGYSVMDIRNICLDFGSKRVVRLVNDNQGWHYTTEGNLPKLQCIRFFATGTGYKYRITLPNTSGDNSDIMDRLSCNLYAVSEAIPMSYYIRLVTMANKAISASGEEIFRIDNNAMHIVMANVQNEEQRLRYRGIYEMLAVSTLPIDNLKKFIMIKTDTLDTLAYRAIALLAGVANISYVLFSKPMSTMEEVFGTGYQRVNLNIRQS